MHICLRRIAPVASCGLAVNVFSSIINQEPFTVFLSFPIGGKIVGVYSRPHCHFERPVRRSVSGLTKVGATNLVFDGFRPGSEKISPPEENDEETVNVQRTTVNSERSATITAMRYGQKPKRAMKGRKRGPPKLFLGPVVF